MAFFSGAWLTVARFLQRRLDGAQGQPAVRLMEDYRNFSITVLFGVPKRMAARRTYTLVLAVFLCEFSIGRVPPRCWFPSGRHGFYRHGSRLRPRTLADQVG
jgi:hypothetical protein